MPIKIIIIGGPTASGKSAYAIKIAQEVGGEIINGDSMQLYAPLCILTARPCNQALAQVPHHLYGVLSGNKDSIGSVAWWQAQAVKNIKDIHSRNKVPIVVGGSGLYLSSLIRGISSVPKIPEAIRTDVTFQANAIGFPGFFEYACTLDPLLKGHLNPNDRHRLMRAVEVYLATGQSITKWHGTATPPLKLEVDFRIINRSREELYQRIDQRFNEMIEEGAIDEVHHLLNKGLPSYSPILKALGVPEIKRFLNKELTLAEATAQGQQSSRRYAKRQLTWFRNQTSDARWVE